VSLHLSHRFDAFDFRTYLLQTNAVYVTYLLSDLYVECEQHSAIAVCVKCHLKDERTDRRRDKETRLIVRPSVRPSVHLFVRCVCQGERAAIYRNLWGEVGGKNHGSTNKYTKFCQPVIKKIIKIAATRCHILKLKCTKFNSRRLSVRLSLTLTIIYECKNT